jgi:hypothetical protein
MRIRKKRRPIKPLDEVTCDKFCSVNPSGSHKLVWRISGSPAYAKATARQAWIISSSGRISDWHAHQFAGAQCRRY